jgi:MFS family permease
LTDRYGGRNVLAAGVALLGATCLLMGRVEGFVGLAVGFTSLRLMVQGPLTLTGTTLVAQWFVRRRGRAQSLMSLGMTAGFAIFPPLTVFLIDRLTWRPAWAAIGLLVWLTLLPAVLLLVRSRPEEIGFRPDGAAPVRPAPADADVAPADDELAWTARQATRTPTFWLLSGSIAVTWLVGAGLNFHQVSILVGEGHTTAFAASIFAVSALASIPATFASGWLLDRGSPRRVLTALLLIQALAAWWLLWSGPPLMALIYGVLNGVMIGASNVVNAVVFAAYYGRRHLGSIRGVTMIVNVAASALGPLPLGLARDLLGSYAPALIALGLLPCLYALAMVWVRPPPPHQFV